MMRYCDDDFYPKGNKHIIETKIGEFIVREKLCPKTGDDRWQVLSPNREIIDVYPTKAGAVAVALQLADLSSRIKPFFAEG